MSKLGDKFTIGNISVNESKTPQKQDQEKTKYHLLDFDFLKSMADTMERGLQRERKPDDWKKIKWTQEIEDRYKSALLRHTLEDFNPAAIACNSMILAYHQKKKQNEK